MILVFLECEPEDFSIALGSNGPIHNQSECMGEGRKKGSWVEKDKGKKRGNLPFGMGDLSPFREELLRLPWAHYLISPQMLSAPQGSSK